MAQVTGGQTFYVDSAKNLEGVYRQINEDLRSQYLLTYYSTNTDTAKDKWRKVEIKVEPTSLSGEDDQRVLPVMAIGTILVLDFGFWIERRAARESKSRIQNPNSILASASPRRAEILRRLGIPFTVQPADVAGGRPPGRDRGGGRRAPGGGEGRVGRGARAGRPGSSRPTRSSFWTGSILGKPETTLEAPSHAAAAGGPRAPRRHRASPEARAPRAGSDTRRCRASASRPWTRRRSPGTSRRASREDKAGAYGVQGLGRPIHRGDPRLVHQRDGPAGPRRLPPAQRRPRSRSCVARAFFRLSFISYIRASASASVLGNSALGWCVAQPTERSIRSRSSPGSLGRWRLASSSAFLRGRRLVGLGQQDQELVAAPAEDQVRLAHARRQIVRHELEHPVPDRVAAHVVDLLEPVDVDQEDRERAPVAARARELAADHVVEVVAVVEARSGGRGSPSP